MLNEAQRIMCFEGKVLMTCATASTVAAQEEYSLPSDFGKMEAVFLYSSTTAKQKLTPIRVGQRDPLKTQGIPAWYYVWGLNVSSVNAITIGLNPIPSTSGSSDLEIYYRQLPLTMVSGGQAPEVPTQWQDGLTAYAAWKTYQRRGREWQSMARDAQAEWQGWINMAKRYTNPLTTDSPTSSNDSAGYMYWGGN